MWTGGQDIQELDRSSWREKKEGQNAKKEIAGFGNH